MVSRSPNLFSKALFTTLAFTILLAPSGNSASATDTPGPPLLSTAEVRKLSRAEMAELNEVRIRGAVTFVSNAWKVLFVYQGGQSVKVGFEADLQVSVGTLVEIKGQIVGGDVGPVIVATDLRELRDDEHGKEFEPVPLKIDETTSFSVSVVDQWVEFEGPAYSAVADSKYHYVSLAGTQFGVYAIIPNSADLPPLEILRDARLRVRGIPGISLQPGAQGQIDLLLPDSSFVEVVTAADEAVDRMPRKIGEIGRVDLRGTTEAPARIRAVVRGVSDSRRFFVADETGSLMVETHADISIDQMTVGDVVEVEGRVIRNQKHEYITESMVRYIGKGFSLHPELVTGQEALKRPAELVEIDGTLVSEDGDTHSLLLKNGIHSFRVHTSEAMSDALSRWSIGSRLRFSGCTWVSEGLDADFELYPNTVSVIFGLPGDTETNEDSASVQAETLADAAPGWSGERAAGGLPFPPPPFFLRPPAIIALLITLVLLGVAMVWLIQRRLKAQENAQEKFHESIHEQLSNLSHIARLNTLSEMVGALAHELNQPLASVSNYAAAAELVSRKEPADPQKLAGLMTNIGQEAFRAGEIIRRLRHLVRKKTPGSLPVQISEIIHETVELFKTQHVTASGLVQVDVPDDLPFVQADSVQIQQVILNLLLNARDATEAEPERTSEIQVASRFEDGLVTVSVSDNGIGVASSTPDAIFEPYFTTREKGTGLGLAISRTIIESHAGRITAENGTPHGTKITFSLPVSRAKANIAG
ncbi:MAG: signal transduction histidine kinase [Planctomycetaceae bacterium]